MDIGKFKASRGRLLAWFLVPPLAMATAGLSSHWLLLRSQWELERATRLGELLPGIVQARRSVDLLLKDYREFGSGQIQTEDELIAFLNEAARKNSFVADTVSVERKTAAELPALVAKIDGNGTLEQIERFLGDVVTVQHLLYETQMTISQSGGGSAGRGIVSWSGTAAESVAVPAGGVYRASITFELVLFNATQEGR